MTSPRNPFHEYSDLSLSPAYVLGYAFHGLGRLQARSRVHGRLGARKLVDELLATLTFLKLTESLRVSEPLRQLQHTMSHCRRFARVGETVVAEVAALLPRIESAVQVELRARRPQEVAAFTRCPEALRFDLAEARRAMVARLPTAAVFHLYRVWDALHAARLGVTRLDGSAIRDPRTDSTIRSEESDATALLGAIQRQLERLP